MKPPVATFPEPDGEGIVAVDCPLLLRPDGGEPLDPGWSLLSAFAPAIAARAAPSVGVTDQSLSK